MYIHGSMMWTLNWSQVFSFCDLKNIEELFSLSMLLANIILHFHLYKPLFRFEGYANEKELEKRAQELSDKKQMLAGTH